VLEVKRRRVANETNVFKGTFNDWTWVKFFQTLGLASHQLPKPLSEILVEQLVNEDLVDNAKSVLSITDRLHSDGFKRAVCKAINLMVNETSFNNSNDYNYDVLSSEMAILLGQISVFKTREIKTFYFDKSTDMPVEESERESSFACLKRSSCPNYGTRFLVSEKAADGKYFYFHLATIILSEMRLLFESERGKKVQTFGDIVKRKSSNLVFLLTEFLTTADEDYNRVIGEYKANSFFSS
jgi:hypothetical protein